MLNNQQQPFAQYDSFIICLFKHRVIQIFYNNVKVLGEKSLISENFTTILFNQFIYFLRFYLKI